MFVSINTQYFNLKLSREVTTFGELRKEAAGWCGRSLTFTRCHTQTAPRLPLLICTESVWKNSFRMQTKLAPKENDVVSLPRTMKTRQRELALSTLAGKNFKSPFMMLCATYMQVWAGILFFKSRCVHTGTWSWCLSKELSVSIYRLLNRPPTKNVSLFMNTFLKTSGHSMQ